MKRPIRLTTIRTRLALVLPASFAPPRFGLL